MKKTFVIFLIAVSLFVPILTVTIKVCSAATASDYYAVAPFVTAGVPPLVMLVMGRNHKLYYEAYNDASDLNEDGTLDVGYNPEIDYYGYFDSYKSYVYNSANSRFEPSATQDGSTKTCSGADEWSGDFLNYLTMSRMDCLRKVLYGGYRSTDTDSETILQRAYIPQDAHSWGKEYKNIEHDGYDIRDYTPLELPQSGTRHLFASTTLSDNGNPLLRVLPYNTHRIWEWVAKEGPVCDSSLERATAQVHPGHPMNHSEFDSMVDEFATVDRQFGSGSPPNGRIDGYGNPWGDGYSPYDSGADDQNNFLTVFSGEIWISNSGDYEFAIDGDDAIELIIDGNVVVGWYDEHSRCGDTEACKDAHKGTVTLAGGDGGAHKSYSIEFRHEEETGVDNYYLYWKGPDSSNNWQVIPHKYRLGSNYSGLELTQTTYSFLSPASTITDYIVRVLVADSSMPESNCKEYPDGNYKPIGLLQRHGESERMYFGLLSGSYTKNTSGGVLRKNIGTINDEINPDTGEFLYKDDSSVKGIIKTIDNFRITEFVYAPPDYYYSPGWPGAWLGTAAMGEGEFPDWGNPVAEMMYETLRYFAGKASPTTAYHSATMADDDALGLPNEAWVDPYDVSTGFDYCAKPFMLVLSDINPTYDSDQLPGSNSNFGSFTGDLTGMNVDTLGDTIFSEEGLSGQFYIGQSGATYNCACTAKSINGFGDIRGLCPEEPTKQGSYYSASVAYYGRTHDISAADEDQKVLTYAVGLASPLPKIEIPLGDHIITLVPFAKSVGGCLVTNSDFQPTNTIVDFFVETITDTYGKFRINFEDVEQAADHDMDAIVEYEYTVTSENTVDITLNSTYAAGCIIQHMGYIISGTTEDGTYLVVRDTDINDPYGDYRLIPEGAEANSLDVDYELDMPNDAGVALPLSSTRTFTKGDSPAATLLKDPLWYAAKWGGFEESEDDSNDKPDKDSEWDKDLDGVPDTYFYVVNPLKLEEQLEKSFTDILRRTSSGTAASVISNTRSGEGALYQALFFPEYKGPLGNKITWSGQIHALLVDAYGNMREDTPTELYPNGNKKLNLEIDKIILFDGSTVYKYGDDNGNSRIDSDEEIPDEIGTMSDIHFLWNSNEWLNEMSDTNAVTQRGSYNSVLQQRYIFTFIDANENMIADAGEQVPFVCPSLPAAADLTDTTKIFPYIQVGPTFGDEPYIVYDGSSISMDNFRTNHASDFDDFLQHQTQRVINYIRGEDQLQYDSTTAPSYTIPAFRSRKVDYDEDNTVETWRLADCIYSTPTFVGRPTEAYHMIYRDSSYAEFAAHYNNRRGVVYVGSNDGMFHAFNSGFFDYKNNEFLKSPTSDTSSPDYRTEFDLGAELWAYVPYNLLPHLYWLTEQGYGPPDAHVYYCDLKPRIFDAKIFPDDADHINGWGTVLVGGMRLGGGKIGADMDKTDGPGYVDGTDRTMRSAYFILDITNPEVPPTLLGEITFDDLGFTTCYPGVIPMKDKDLPPGNTINENDWYLVLGSGPADVNGDPDKSVLPDNICSKQPATLYIIDLVKLATDKEIWTVNSAGVFAFGSNFFVKVDSNSFVSDPITVDYPDPVDGNLDYNADAVYFGTVSGDSTSGWGGKFRRIVIENDLDTTNWVGDSTFIDLTAVENGQPITAAPTVAMDKVGNKWLFFGTGRFFDRSDALNSDQQSYYGIKEPVTGDPAVMTWGPVTISGTSPYDVDKGLLDVSVAKVYLADEAGNVEVQGVSGVTEWYDESDYDLTDAINDKSGWYINFQEPKERNIGQATLLGGILAFTTYLPSLDPCEFEGDSYLYALYYLTGTAYKQFVIGTEEEVVGEETKERVLKKTPLGKGLAVTPNIHEGRGNNPKLLVQKSTGGVVPIEQASPGQTKSGATSWREMDSVVNCNPSTSP